MRIARVLSLILGAVVALIAASLLAVWLLVNPNDFKPRIAATVKAATGRELLLTGDIRLSVFPWIALELGPASLGNPPGFDDQPFLSFKRAAVRLRMLPLLAKRLDVGRVEIDDLDLNLARNAQGRGNWQGFGRDGSTATAPPPAAGASAGESVRGIAGITVTHARLHYQDLTVENLQLETGSFAGKGVVPVTLHLEAKRAAGDSMSLDARLHFSVDSTDKQLSMAALDLDGAVILAGNPRPIRWRIGEPAVDVDLDRQTVSVPKIALTAAGAELTGDIEGSKILDAPVISGHFTLSPLIVREFLPRLGMTAPVTRDPKAFSVVSAAGEFRYGDNMAQVDHLSAVLDETHLSGGAGMKVDSHAFSFALAVDRIDIDRYLPPAVSTAPYPSAPAPLPAPAPRAATASTLDVEGRLSVGALHAAPLDLAQVNATLTAKDGVLRLYPLSAQVDGGQYAGDITLDERGSTPELSMDQHLTGIDVGQLLASESKKLRISGHGNVNLKATGKGAGADAILQSLNGHFDAAVTGGALEGVDLAYEIDEADALIRRSPSPTRPNTHRTGFDAFKLSAEIASGVATTKDLTISSTALKVTGQGSATLGTQALDLALLVDTLRSAGNTPVRIPVKVTGTFTDPTVRPDVEALAKGELKQKAEDVLKEKLKGLFGKP